MAEEPVILVLLDPVEDAIARVRSECPRAEVRLGPWVANAEETLPKKLMAGVEILLCEVPPANFDDFDSLRWIQLTSHGYTQVLDLPVSKREIRVSIGLGNFDIPIAEWNIMMMLIWHRHMLEMLEHQKDQKWDRSARFQSELRGATVGFYGYGGIARQTARLAKAMGLVVWSLTRNGKIRSRSDKYCLAGTGDPEGLFCDRVFGLEEQEEFLAGTDYLVLTMPLTPATQGLMGEQELRMLKPSCVLINPARAAIVEENALLRCMREGWIRGAALDVHYAYPLPPKHPLWSMPNVILTPHISGSCASPHFLERTYDIFVQNLRRYRSGQSLLNELTAEQLAGQ